MKVDSVITLENDVNCLLLEQVRYEENNYFSAVVLNEEEEPTEEFVVFKEIVEDGENYVEKVEDSNVLAELTNLFTNSLKSKINSLPDEF